MSGHEMTREAMDLANPWEMLEAIQIRALAMWKVGLEEQADLIVKRMKPDDYVMRALTVKNGDVCYWRDMRNTKRRYNFDVVCTRVERKKICRAGISVEEDNSLVHQAFWKDYGAKYLFEFRVNNSIVVFDIEYYERVSSCHRRQTFFDRVFMNTSITVHDNTRWTKKEFNNVWLRGVTWDHGIYYDNKMECVRTSDEDPLELSGFESQKPVAEACVFLLLEKREELGIGF